MAFVHTDKSKFNFLKCGLCGGLTSASACTYGVCPNCVSEDQRLYGIARDAMELNQNISLTDLRQKTGIDPKVIQRWADTGRFRSNR